MKNRKITKIALVILSLAIVIGSVVGLSVGAEEEGAVAIKAQNIVYGEKVAIAYAVDASIEDAVAGKVKVSYYWEEDGVTSVKSAVLLDTTDENNLYTVDDVNYPVFVTEGVAPKELAKVAYAVAYTGDVIPESAAYKTYSAAEYLYARLYKDGFVNKTAEDGKEYNRKLLYENLLAYGEQAQIVLDYNTDKLVTDYSYIFTESELVTVNGGRTVFGYGELSVAGTVLGEGMIAGWTVTDLVNGNETASEQVVIALNGIYKVEPIFGVHECADENNDHLCDSCGEVASTCVNVNNTVDHLCDICGKVVDSCVDEGTDGRCDVCSVYVFEGNSVLSGSNVTIRNITTTEDSFATSENANTNSSSISTGAPATAPHGAYMYLDSPTAAAGKVLVINTLNAGGSTPTGCTKVTDNLSDIIFTPDVAVEDGDLIVLEFDYCLSAITKAQTNGYPMLWYLDYNGDTADTTLNGIYSYNKGTPRLNADNNANYKFEKESWVRIRLVCDNTNKKLYTYVSNDGGANYNLCTDITALAAAVDNIGFSFNVYSLDCLQYVDNIKCVKTNAATYGISFE